MNLSKTRLHIISETSDLAKKARTGVSLHCHTEYSKEMLDFIPHYADRLPIIATFWKREREKYLAKEGKGIDFSTAYWSPPLPPGEVYNIERKQIEEAGLSPIVSLTDHDSIDATLEVNENFDNSVAPISMEWTVPFEYGFFHVGVHNLPSDRAVDITKTLLDFTFSEEERTENELTELFAMLHEMPQVLVILNHPLWDIEIVGQERHEILLKRFLRVHGKWIHAFEINGFRSWSENKAVIELAEATATAEADDAIQVVVTGEQDEGYNPSAASTATRTDTPLRDIPQSIQVVPRQVLEDRRPRDLIEAVETVSGVINGGDNFGVGVSSRIIRGFTTDGNFRNGFRDADAFTPTAIETIERVEVLKGPASVLFGAVEPGGIVNVITRQPLSDPYYNLEFEAGNYGFYQPSIDLSGPLTADDTLLYRFIASYQTSDSFVDFANSELITIAPSITLNLGDQTALNLYYEYIRSEEDPFKADIPVFNDNTFGLPRNRYVGYPDIDFATNNSHRFGYILTHQFNDNWQIRNNIAIVANSNADAFTVFSDLVDDRIFQGSSDTRREYAIDNYFGQIDLLGEFNTGTISHQLLIGFDANRNVENSLGRSGQGPGDLDLFDPDYDISDYEFIPNSRFGFYELIQSYGVYLQDQISLLDKLKLLIGGRVDWVERIFEIAGESAQEQNDSAFSPRIGLVYQPSETVSLYGSYSQSFVPTFGSNPDGRAFEPTRGTQYEIGLRTDFLDGRLSANLAAYHLTKSNVTTPDPDNPNFSIQVGEQRSQGVELDIGGEILPGWNLVASYAYTDAQTTRDNAIEEGNLLPNVPENQASLWTTYEIQTGALQGLGFGLGLFYIGERQGDLENSFQLDSYLRTDAAIYYRKDRFNAAINVRNLFDTVHYDFSYGRFYNQVGDPFTIIGSVSWQF
ncbi:TonB-dependent siderophore receptor [Leptolyngbya sp. 7M]|uniref:TonB-dependent siderophore receptor n=1 Tax=Leptolyngbya sp. 7M TaxID=2812896 RepID=UPI001B8A9B5A|nr:TonB-dependent siderophore receptor [Leptolyngbya sp. 7M]QYO67378.1 TonB-dependent siderophore receptor [Leptolyngbya sp. 7M]